MRAAPPADQAAAERILSRLLQNSFDQPVLCNTERGMYVEYMIQAALGDAWQLTGVWDGWDLDRARDGARIEVKQSAALVNWGGGSAPEETKTKPRFDIKARRERWDGSRSIPFAAPTRPADLYIFAWHAATDPRRADQRDPAQWQFYVVPEADLPPQHSLGLRPLTRLSRAHAYQQLPQAVARALHGRPRKAEQEQWEAADA